MKEQWIDTIINNKEFFYVAKYAVYNPSSYARKWSYDLILKIDNIEFRIAGKKFDTEDKSSELMDLLNDDVNIIKYENNLISCRTFIKNILLKELEKRDKVYNRYIQYSRQEKLNLLNL